MLNPRHYTLENVERARYALYVVALISIVISGYLIFSTLFSMRTILSAEQEVRKAKTELATMSRSLANLKQREATEAPPGEGGTDKFAVQFEKWAIDRGIAIESVVPEGNPVATEIKIDNSKLGMWQANKVRVKGQGDFIPVMDLLNQFKRPGMPVQIESFLFQSSSRQGDQIAFELLVTVYEKKAGSN